MNIRTRKFTAALLLLAGAASFTAQGFAQATAANAPKEETLTLEKFEVTGSLIKVSEMVGPSPIDVVTDRQIMSSGVTDTTQLLKKLNPGFQGNGNVSTELNNGGGGEAYVALRNLTTLVLLNGRRIVNSPYSSGASVDLNTVPLSAIDHIEILKDGASTTYGSDAIGGVVNVILKKNYNGFETRARFGSTGSRDYTTRGASIFGGVSKDGSSITIGVDYFKNDQLSTTSRGVASMDVAALNAAGNSAALPSYYSSSFAGRVGNFVIAGSDLMKGAPGYNAAIKGPTPKTNPNAPAQTIQQLAATGLYLPLTDSPISKAQNNGATILNTTLFGTACIVPTDRRQVVLNADHEIYGKSLVAFADGLYSQTTNRGTVLAPSPLAGVAANNLTIPANNPYNLFGIAIGVGGGADPGVRTRLEEVGNRARVSGTDTYRLVAGLKGEINENYSWQVDGTYSKADWLQNVYGGANGAVMQKLLTPQLNAAGTAYVYDAAGKPLSTFSDSQGPVPVYNYFGVFGANDPRAIAGIQAVLFQSGITELTQVNVLFRGTPYNLPAGKLAFAIGGEYRKEELTTSVDGLFAQGLALGYNAASTFSGGKRSTKSAAIEVEVPVFGANFRAPGAYLLNVNLAGRYESLSTGETSKVPKVGFKWQPFNRDLSVRGTYAKGFIAPSIFNLFAPPQGNSPTFTVLQGNGTTGSGGSTGAFVTGQFGSNVSELSNPNLGASKSMSKTLGLVYSPSQVKGLSLNLDYYFIRQDHVGGINYSGIFGDLNAKGSGSQYASAFEFTNGSKLTSSAPNQVTSTNIGKISVQTNPSGEEYTDGLDIGINYDVPASIMSDKGKLTVGANANVLFNFKFHANPQSGNQQYARQQTSATFGLGGSQGVLPGYVTRYFANWNYKGFNVNGLISYTPSVIDAGSLFGDHRAQIADPVNTGHLLPANTKRKDEKAYAIPSYTTMDLHVSYLFQRKGMLNNVGVLVGVNNLTNKTAPYIPDGNEDNTDKRTYDIVGRFWVFEISKKF